MESGEKYVVLSGWSAPSANNLDLSKGEIVHVTKKLDTGWCLGVKNGKKGWFPASYVRLASEPEPVVPAEPTIQKPSVDQFDAAFAAMEDLVVHNAQTQVQNQSSVPRQMNDMSGGTYDNAPASGQSFSTGEYQRTEKNLILVRAEIQNLKLELSVATEDARRQDSLRREFEETNSAISKLERFVQMVKPKIDAYTELENEAKTLTAYNDRSREMLNVFREKAKDTVKSIQSKYRESIDDLEAQISEERKRNEKVLDEMSEERHEMSSFLRQLQDENESRIDDQSENDRLVRQLNKLQDETEALEARSRRMQRNQDETDVRHQERRKEREGFYERELRRKERQQDIVKLRTSSSTSLSGIQGDSLRSSSTRIGMNRLSAGGDGKSVSKSRSTADFRRATVNFGSHRPNFGEFGVDIDSFEMSNGGGLSFDDGRSRRGNGGRKVATGSLKGRPSMAMTSMEYDRNVRSGIRENESAKDRGDRLRKLKSKSMAPTSRESLRGKNRRISLGDDMDLFNSSSSRSRQAKREPSFERLSTSLLDSSGTSGKKPLKKDRSSDRLLKAKKSKEPSAAAEKESEIVEVIAKHKWEAKASDQLSFSKKDRINVSVMSENGWFYGECNGNNGWFPSTFVHVTKKLPTTTLGEVVHDTVTAKSKQPKKEKKERVASEATDALLDQLLGTPQQSTTMRKKKSPLKNVLNDRVGDIRRVASMVEIFHTPIVRGSDSTTSRPVHHTDDEPTVIGNVIVSHLDPNKLAIASGVSKEWNHICEHNSVWKNVTRRFFPIAVNDPSPLVAEKLGPSWKQNFKVLRQTQKARPMNHFANGSYSAAVSSMRDMYLWGKGPDDCDYFLATDGPTPKKVIANKEGIIDFALSHEMIACVADSGVLYTWGDGKMGKLGHGSMSSLSFPKEVKYFSDRNTKVACVAIGRSHAVCATTGGSVYSWGNKRGASQPEDFSTPHQIISLTATPIISVACGRGHTLALSETNELYGWGENEKAQVGSGDFGGFPKSPTSCVGIQNVKILTMACGEVHSAACSLTGHLYCWGSDEHGQCGLDSDPNINSAIISTPTKVKAPAIEGFDGNIVNVGCGANHTLVVTNNGLLYTFGLNAYGQLGHSGVKSARVPIQVNAFDQSSIVAACAGEAHSVAITKEGRVYTWGRGSHGQLGHGVNKSSVRPKLVEGLMSIRVASLVQPM